MKYISLIFSVLIFHLQLNAQATDTILNMVLSKPYFYNIVKDRDENLFAGTSNGVYKINNTELRHYGSIKGYITINKTGEPILDSSGIRYYKEKKFSHLLPFPELVREEYHAQKGNNLYICSGGRLYIYEIEPYEYSYAEHSIRSISKNLVGTYSGVYLNGKKLPYPAPNFTDGFIRQFGDRAFICNYGLSVLEKDAILSGKLIPDVSYKLCDAHQNTPVNDISLSPNGNQYYIATENALYLSDYNFKKDTILFKHEHKDNPITLITEDKHKLYFTSQEELYELNYKTGKIQSFLKLNEPILSGIYLEFQIYLTAANGLYRYNSGRQIEKLADLEKAHTLAKISESELVISSDYGLFLFNIASRTLLPIINGVEFNRKALFVNDDTLYAGSINGLYKIRFKDFPTLIERNKVSKGQSDFPIIILLIVSILIVIILILIIALRKYRKKLNAEKEIILSLKTPIETVTREKIETYIQNNLPVASIKTLMDTFHLNGGQLYDILKPDRPGTLIQQIRMTAVKNMREKGQTHEEIAEATGFSISYLKKLKTK